MTTTPPDDEEPVPKVPRGRFLTRVQARDVMAIFMLLVTLVAVLALRQGCSQGVGSLFKALEGPADAAPRVLPPSSVPLSPPERPSGR